jgi:PAS domain S-box-containing protein
LQHKKNAIENKSHSLNLQNCKKHIVWVEEFGDAIYKDGKIEFIEGIFIDITERKKNETVLQQKRISGGGQ